MITVKQYQKALQSLTDGRKNILKLLYEIEPAADANEIAEKLGYKGFGGANLQIGNIGKAICKFLDIQPDLTGYNESVQEGGYFIVIHRQYRDDQGIYWDMEPNLIAAIERLDWVNKNTKTNYEILSTEIAEENIETFPEGTLIPVLIDRFERDKKAREIALKIHGSLCKGCKIDFKKQYGDDIDPIIHIHHIIPLSMLIKGRKTNPQTDLIPLCPNCHAVIHSKSELMTLKELQQRIKRVPH
jgi:5-methylcytosine-specific restriction protein A